MPSVALQARENGAVGGDVDEGEQSGRGGVDGGAVAVLQEAELDGEQLCALDGVGGSVRRPHCAPRAPGFAEDGSVGKSGLYGVVGRGGVVELGEEAGGGAPIANDMKLAVGFQSPKRPCPRLRLTALSTRIKRGRNSLRSYFSYPGPDYLYFPSKQHSPSSTN